MSIPDRVLMLIRDDSYAATFQSLGQYRAALLQAGAVKDSLTAHGMPIGAWAVLGSNGSIRAWSDRRDHPTLIKLKEEGATVVQLAWPLLDAPALIGGVVVGKGCSSGHVVMIAKRKYQYETERSPDEHERSQKAFQDALAQIHEEISQRPTEDRCEYCDGTGDVHWMGRWERECCCKKTPTEQQPPQGVAGLTEALRQFQHNDRAGLVFGYDRTRVDKYVARLEELARTEQEIQRAAGTLPEGWSIQLELENGAGYAVLYSPQGIPVEYGDDFDGIADQIHAATNHALEVINQGGAA